MSGCRRLLAGTLWISICRRGIRAYRWASEDGDEKTVEKEYIHICFIAFSFYRLRNCVFVCSIWMFSWRSHKFTAVRLAAIYFIGFVNGIVIINTCFMSKRPTKIFNFLFFFILRSVFKSIIIIIIIIHLSSNSNHIRIFRGSRLNADPKSSPCWGSWVIFWLSGRPVVWEQMKRY